MASPTAPLSELPGTPVEPLEALNREQGQPGLGRREGDQHGAPRRVARGHWIREKAEHDQGQAAAQGEDRSNQDRRRRAAQIMKPAFQALPRFRRQTARLRAPAKVTQAK